MIKVKKPDSGKVIQQQQQKNHFILASTRERKHTFEDVAMWINCCVKNLIENHKMSFSPHRWVAEATADTDPLTLSFFTQ